ncbi:hypothetical protein VU10_02760 [Desulfobulbus sp. US1]|uniref:DUF8180 domain-containing protein n=1 Tax=Candidatus Electrothrix communis TaxID=1859133 RepID=A0A444J998_9BACT|nr:hypothetical protein [Desulfobulbus sp. US4]MCW5204342.1 hypothetical protein [Desulfobulbus sp. N2]MCW5207508.1 hypothetical protein [Desulfobulbus sp. US2]MCW5209121.1 hypothetical protein [Desulfobulbus sp. US1]MCW5213884.1 hypothetical protein [Desulfobulbus sp. US5]RWX49661.1 hypothetical protein VT98_10215 [Candidatus Electrothrix communis]
MNDIDKLRVMLPHWINHNQGHGGEFAQWAKKLTADSPEVAQLLRDAVQSLQKAQSYLEEALNKAGGPLEAPGGQGKHEHNHEHNHKHGHTHDSDDGGHHHHS